MYGSARRAIAIVGAGLIALSLQHVDAQSASACGLLGNLLGCGSPQADEEPAGLLPAVTNSVDVDLELPELAIPGVGTVNLPDVALSDGTATVTGPALDIDAPLLPGVGMTETTTSVGLPAVNVSEPPGGGLPGVTIDPGYVDTELPTVSIDSGNSPVELPSITVHGGGISADLPTIGVDPSADSGLLPGVSIGSGSVGLELPDAEVSGALGPIGLPTIAVDGGSATVTTPGIWTSPDGPLGLPSINIGSGGTTVELPGVTTGEEPGVAPGTGDPVTPPAIGPALPGGSDLPGGQSPEPTTPGSQAPGTTGNGPRPVPSWTFGEPTSGDTHTNAPARPGVTPGAPGHAPTQNPPVVPSWPTMPTFDGGTAGPVADGGGPAWQSTAPVPATTATVHIADAPVPDAGPEVSILRTTRGTGLMASTIASAAGTFSAGAAGAPFVACLAALAVLAILGRQLLVLAPAARCPASCSYRPIIPPA